jgi:hypothetical protein
MLRVANKPIMLSVVMLNVVMLNVVTPKKPLGINAEKLFLTSSLTVGRKELFTIKKITLYKKRLVSRINPNLLLKIIL